MKFYAKILAASLFGVFLLSGAYIGYLSALVDKDQMAFIEQVRASTDEERLKKQLARAKSILEARRRAYERLSKEFLAQQKRRPKPVVVKKKEPIITPVPKAPEVKEQATPEEPRQVLPETVQPQLTRRAIEDQLASAIATSEVKEREAEHSLAEDKKDIEFFENEVAIVTQMIERRPNEDEIHEAEKRRGRISEALRKVLLLNDKRNSLAADRAETKSKDDYWKTHPKGSSQSIDIAVNSKDGIQRGLSPAHVTQIATALSVMPRGFENRLQHIYIVYGDPKMRRGMTGLGVVFMKGEEADLFRVIVHEFGHAYDLYREVADGTKSDFYDGEYRLFEEDPSAQYYHLSWKNAHERALDLPAFASSYGMSDPFEDFAEAFALYVLQNKTFVSWKAGNDILQKKYEFLSKAFDGRVFPSVRLFSARPYDVTMLEVDYEQLLAGL